MKEVYLDLRKKFQIPKTHILKKGKYKEKDRSTFSIEESEILEYDENSKLIARYIREEYVDSSGIKVFFHQVNN